MTTTPTPSAPYLGDRSVAFGERRPYILTPAMANHPSRKATPKPPLG